MVEFMNWILLFFKDAILTLFSLTSSDGYSLGYMALGITIVGLVVTATIGAVALGSRMIRINSYIDSRRHGGDNNGTN